MKKIFPLLLLALSASAFSYDQVTVGGATYTCPNQCEVDYDNDLGHVVRDSGGGRVTKAGFQGGN